MSKRKRSPTPQSDHDSDTAPPPTQRQRSSASGVSDVASRLLTSFSKSTGKSTKASSRSTRSSRSNRRAASEEANKGYTGRSKKGKDKAAVVTTKGVSSRGSVKAGQIVLIPCGVSGCDANTDDETGDYLPSSQSVNDASATPSLTLVKEVKEMTAYNIGAVHAKQGLAVVAEVEPFYMDPAWSSEEVFTFLKGTQLGAAFDFLAHGGLSEVTFYVCTTNGSGKELVVVPEVPTGATVARYIVKRKGSSWREATVYIASAASFTARDLRKWNKGKAVTAPSVSAPVFDEQNNFLNDTMEDSAPVAGPSHHSTAVDTDTISLNTDATADEDAAVYVPTISTPPPPPPRQPPRSPSPLFLRPRGISRRSPSPIFRLDPTLEDLCG